MILAGLIIIPLIGGLAAWILGRRNEALPRWISLATLFIDVVLLVILWSRPSSQIMLERGAWLAELSAAWIPQLGIGIHLAVDGLSLVLVALTLFLGILSILCSWTEIRERVGFFHLNIMAILSGVLGVFLSLDLFLFYLFWELMLVPMYFLISIWGHENRVYASLKFFIFTQAGGLFMLLSILGLYFLHGKETGTYTFDYSLLLKTSLPPASSFWLMGGFLISFLVKIPAFPFHPWLPDAHTEAPTAGSVILAGLLLKTGAYGLLRFVLPLFPLTATAITPLMLVLGVIGIMYGAVLSFAQTDLKRLVAYTSVSHMGFVLLGIFAWNTTSLQGAVMQMLAHGVSTGALFIIVGLIQERIHTRDMERMGGLWVIVPRLSGMAMIFGLASLGLPGFGNFVAEFMVLLGSFRVHGVVTAFAATGLVLSAIYALWMIQRTFQGEQRGAAAVRDLSTRETGMIAVMVIAIFWLGLYPRPVLKTTGPTLSTLQYIPVPDHVIDAGPDEGPVKNGKTVRTALTGDRRRL
jgi:NADH-quinone oxidoreductase subunit M